MRKIILVVTGMIFVVMLSSIIYFEYQHSEEILEKKENMEHQKISQQETLGEVQADGNANLDISEYFFETSDSSKPNNELQNYVPYQAKFDGNQIHVTANNFQDGYVSGKVETKNAFRYGNFSFKIKTLKKTGLFPAIWMLPVGGKRYPEVDIYEMIGSEPEWVYGVMHWENGTDLLKSDFEYRLDEKQIEDSYFLEFQWTPEKMVWFLDGVKIGEISENLPEEPMYMIVNLAVGGNWPGNPNREELPETFELEVVEFEPVEIHER